MGGVAGRWQSSWYLCGRCGVLFRADQDPVPFFGPTQQTGGARAAGGTHDGQGGHPMAVFVGDSAAGAQGGWRRCGKCSSLYEGTGDVGKCPADGGTHSGDGGDDLLAEIDQGAPGMQGGWHYCRSCTALFLPGASGDVCPSGGQHQQLSRFVFRPGVGPLTYAVVLDNARFLPHGRACSSGADVDLKVNTHICPVDWVGLTTGNWDSSPQSPWQLMFAAGPVSDWVSAVRLAVSMLPDGTAVIDQFVFNLTQQGQNTVKQVSSAISPPVIQALGLGLPPFTGTAENFFVGSFSDCESDDGNNNNGVGTLVRGQLAGQTLALNMWPKREDRIRVDVLLPGRVTLNMELDTHE
jgi:hypothetical protein